MAFTLKNIKDIPGLLKETYKEWNEEDPFDLSAVVAYYAIFSLPALLIIVVTIASVFFGREAVEGHITGQISNMIGKEGAVQVQTMIANARKTGNTVLTSIIGIATLLIGATSVFLTLQKSLNKVWDVKPDPKKGGWKRLLQVRAISFGVVLSLGFLLLISLVVTTGLTALSDWLADRLPEYMLYVFHIINFIVSFGIIWLLFAVLYKFLPDAKIEWRSVWVGAAMTAFLFTLGKFALGFYFGKTNPGSTYGAAGAIILMLLWVSYSCLILFFGAEFTKVYAEKYGHRIEPTNEAVYEKGFENNYSKKENTNKVEPETAKKYT